MPFLKWAGGKRRLVTHLAKFCPDNLDRYFEPFLGSGALFFHLAQTRPDFTAVLSDSNPELINVYRCVRDNVMELIEILRRHQGEYFIGLEKYYYKIRNCHRPSNEVERAARIIFLNRTCYNGLFRVNKSGHFNVPHGSYHRPTICNSKMLLPISVILQKKDLQILCDSYQNVIARCNPGDVVYLDPPYMPISPTANFTDYTKESFSCLDHERLASELRRLDTIGCKVLLSNSNSAAVRDLYMGFQISTVGTTRLINCNAKNRAGHNELIISNVNFTLADGSRKNIQAKNF